MVMCVFCCSCGFVIPLYIYLESQNPKPKTVKNVFLFRFFQCTKVYMNEFCATQNINPPLFMTKDINIDKNSINHDTTHPHIPNKNMGKERKKHGKSMGKHMVNVFCLYVHVYVSDIKVWCFWF